VLFKEPLNDILNDIPNDLFNDLFIVSFAVLSIRPLLGSQESI
jgi:hypothetical protein